MFPQPQIGIDVFAKTLRIKHAKILDCDPKVEPETRPVGYASLCCQRAAPNRCLELRDIQPILSEDQHTIAVLHADRQIAAREVGIHDLNLAVEG